MPNSYTARVRRNLVPTNGRVAQVSRACSLGRERVGDGQDYGAHMLLSDAMRRSQMRR